MYASYLVLLCLKPHVQCCACQFTITIHTRSFFYTIKLVFTCHRRSNRFSLISLAHYSENNIDLTILLIRNNRHCMYSIQFTIWCNLYQTRFNGRELMAVNFSWFTLKDLITPAPVWFDIHLNGNPELKPKRLLIWSLYHCNNRWW